MALRAERQNKAAIDLLEKALAKKPKDPQLSGNLAKSYRAEKRFVEAIPHYETAIAAEGSKDPGLYFDVGYCYQQTNQKEKAIAAYRKNLELIRFKDAKGAENVQAMIDQLEGK